MVATWSDMWWKVLAFAMGLAMGISIGLTSRSPEWCFCEKTPSASCVRSSIVKGE